MKRLSEIKKKSGAELEKLLAEKRKAVQDFRFSISGAKVKNIKASREDRRDIARILTLMAEEALKKKA